MQAEGFFLRRPISICDINKDKGTIRLVFEVRGHGTDKISELNKGDIVDIIAPLGNGFKVLEKGKKAVCIGGGIGTPPMVGIAKEYGENATVISGFRNAAAVILQEDFKAMGCDVQLCTDDGSAGRKGFVTDALLDVLKSEKPDMVIIDSIQTMVYEQVSSSAGSITQVRECTNVFMHTAKGLGIPIFIVGHVNKDGAIAGPKVLEHIVDTVLYFEGERNYSYRILRGVKNRFGSTNEIGVFEMTAEGLKEVLNPSLMMISGRPKNTSGTCVACVMEGTRPILAEVQGLVCATGFGTPRRMSTGFDYNRMSMLLAVLEKRAGYFFNNMDAYVNVIGGLKLDEPAADLTVALALVSSLKDKAVDDNTIAFGEVGLAGEIRAVNNCEQRVNEAKRLGFERCIIPFHNYKSISNQLKTSTDIIPVRNIREAFSALVEE